MVICQASKEDKGISDIQNVETGKSIMCKWNYGIANDSLLSINMGGKDSISAEECQLRISDRKLGARF